MTLRDRIFALDVFDPGYRKAAFHTLGSLMAGLQTSGMVTVDQLGDELESMKAEGLVSFNKDTGSVTATRAGMIRKRQEMAQQGLLQAPLLHMEDYELSDLIFGLGASHRVDPGVTHSLFDESTLAVLLHQKITTRRFDLISFYHRNNGDRWWSFPFRPNGVPDASAVQITDRGMNHYLTEVRPRLGLPHEASLLTLLKPTVVETRFDRFDLAPGIRDNLNLRWREMEISAAGGAYLSSVTMLGTIVEGVLMARLDADPLGAARSPKAPRNRFGSVKGLPEWSLREAIGVAIDLGYVPPGAAKHLDDLRDTRNLVHPMKQVDDRIHVDEPLYQVSRKAAEMLLDKLAVT